MPRKAVDLTGLRFGRLVCVRRTHGERHNKWLCFCDCGKRAYVQTGSLRAGQTRSCGCLKVEMARARRGVSNNTTRRSALIRLRPRAAELYLDKVDQRAEGLDESEDPDISTARKMGF